MAVAGPLTGWLIRRHLEAVIHGNIVENIERVMEEAGIGRRRDLHPPAIGFLDLSGFTALTVAEGDEAAAKLAVRLCDLVQETTTARGGRAVKSLGDGVMLHFRSRAMPSRRRSSSLMHSPRQGFHQPELELPLGRSCSGTATTSGAS